MIVRSAEMNDEEAEYGNILLKIDSVRCRTTSNGHSGTLVLLDKCFVWKDGNGTTKLLYTYDKIKSQKVSAAGKPKIQLQLILCGDKQEPVTFHFINPAGTEKQTEERDTAKEMLQQLLPKFRSKVSDDLAQKQKILSENRELYALYQDLVTTAVISADEFWENYAKKKVSDQGSRNNQKVGVSPGFLSNLTQMDGCNGLKYNLTLDVIQSIFATYPAVERKHLELVPHEMSDKEFWEKFFQSQYFYRDRTVNVNPKDIFSECLKQDESDMSSQVENAETVERLDLNRIAEEVPIPLIEDSDSGRKSNSGHAALLRRFNYHSSRVLKACLGEEAPSTSQISHIVGASLPQTSKDTVEKPPPSKKRRLEPEECCELVEEDGSEDAPLFLSNSELYRKGFAGNQPSPSRKRDSVSGDVARWGVVMEKVKRRIDHSEKVPETDPSLAAKILIDVSTESSAMLISGDKGQYSKELTEEIRNGYMACAELLRHFWCCFPTKTPDLEKKLERMMDTLKKFESQKLSPLEQKIKNQAGPDVGLLHLRSMLKAAHDKFQSWLDRRASK